MSLSQPTWGDDLEVREYARREHDEGASHGVLAKLLSERLGVTVTKGSVARAIIRYGWPRRPTPIQRLPDRRTPKERPPTRLKKDEARRKVTLPVPEPMAAPVAPVAPVRSMFLDEWHTRCRYLAGEKPYVQCKADRLPLKSYCAAHQKLATRERGSLRDDDEEEAA